jgi:hypothetical protein
METGEVSRQARPRGFGEAAPITADQLASAIASAQTALGMPTPPSPGRVKVLLILMALLLIIRLPYQKSVPAFLLAISSYC